MTIILNDIDYFAKDLQEICCDVCDAFLCNGYIDYADSCGFLCPSCKKQKELEQMGEITRIEQERLAREERQRMCGQSTEGHTWKDVTMQTLCIGEKVYVCTKCDANKSEHLKAVMLPVEYECIKFSQ